MGPQAAPSPFESELPLRVAELVAMQALLTGWESRDVHRRPDDHQRRLLADRVRETTTRLFELMDGLDAQPLSELPDDMKQIHTAVGTELGITFDEIRGKLLGERGPADPLVKQRFEELLEAERAFLTEIRKPTDGDRRSWTELDAPVRRAGEVALGAAGADRMRRINWSRTEAGLDAAVFRLAGRLDSVRRLARAGEKIDAATANRHVVADFAGEYATLVRGAVHLHIPGAVSIPGVPKPESVVWPTEVADALRHIDDNVVLQEKHPSAALELRSLLRTAVRADAREALVQVYVPESERHGPGAWRIPAVVNAVAELAGAPLHDPRRTWPAQVLKGHVAVADVSGSLRSATEPGPGTGSSASAGKDPRIGSDRQRGSAIVPERG